MKVTAVDKYTGEKIYELEMKECKVEHIADVSRSVRLGECWTHMNDIPIQREYSDNNDTFFAAVNAGIAAAEYSNFRPFDVGDYVVCKGTGSYQLGRVASYSNFDRENIFVCYHRGLHGSCYENRRPTSGNGNGAGPRRPRRKIVRISSLRRLVSGLHARALLYILPAVR